MGAEAHWNPVADAWWRCHLCQMCPCYCRFGRVSLPSRPSLYTQKPPTSIPASIGPNKQTVSIVAGSVYQLQSAQPMCVVNNIVCPFSRNRQSNPREWVNNVIKPLLSTTCTS